MSKQLLACLTLVTVATSGLLSRAGAPDTRGVAITNRPAERRVDIAIDGQPFTSYIYPQGFEKPVLYPIRSAAGLLVTRGYVFAHSLVFLVLVCTVFLLSIFI